MPVLFLGTNVGIPLGIARIQNERVPVPIDRDRRWWLSLGYSR